MGVSMAVLGLSWPVLGASWGDLGQMWGHLGATRGLEIGIFAWEVWKKREVDDVELRLL